MKPASQRRSSSLSKRNSAILALALALLGGLSWWRGASDVSPKENPPHKSAELPRPPATGAAAVAAAPVALPQPAGAPAALDPSDRTAPAPGPPEVPDLAKLAAFDNWLSRYKPSAPEQKRLLLEEGVKLAKERRPEFKALISINPEQAMLRAVPRVIRQDLPQSILAQLEEPVSTTGALNVYQGRPAPGMPVPAEGLTLRYFETKDGRSLKARVFGPMEHVLSRTNLPLHGVAIDREFAVAANAVRRLEIGERIPDGTPVEATCPVSGQTTVTPAGGEVVNDSTPTLQIGERIITLCNGSHVSVLEDQFQTFIQASGPGGGGFFVDNFPGTESKAIGNLRCLYIRVTYPDQMAQPNTETQAYADMRDNARFFLENSYGKMTQTTMFTPLITLPHTLSWYKAKDGEVDCLGLIHTDSRNAARDLGYDPGQFNCIIVRVDKGPRLEGISWGGGSSVWITWNGMDVLNHEIGHSLGRNHANSWSSLDGTPYGYGQNSEYGNPFDVMGGGGGFNVHYNSISKRGLDWLSAGYVHTPTTSGTYRVYAYDQPTLEEGKRYALTVAKDSVRQYNIEYHPAIGSYHADSAQVLYSGMGSNAGHLLDTTQGSAAGKNDGGITIGRTFSDLEADMHFTVLSKNATTPASLDISYQRGPFPGNAAPTASLAASSTTVNAGDTVTFNATASDANGDALACQWEFSDGVAGSTSALTTTRTFTAAAQITAMVTASDMKGGTARASVVVNIGAHGKQIIAGSVTSGGQPLADVLVSVIGSYAYTNADGTYSLTNVATGSQTLTATLNGYTLTPGFTNPLTVVAGTNTANWTATAANSVTLTKIADPAEGGSSGSFRLTRSGDTTAALSVLVSPASGTATKTMDYTFSPDYVASGSFYAFTIPAAASTLDITVAAVNDTAAEGPETIKLQLASAAGYFSNSANAVSMTLNDNDTALPMVAVVTTDPYATETPGDTARFVFSRTGTTVASLDVSAAWSGAATHGTDYTAFPATITIPAGQSSVSVAVNPIDDSVIEVLEDVVATISTNAAYLRNASATTATVKISDDDAAVVAVSVADGVVSESGPDAGVFTITRTGSTAAPLKVYYGLSGSAFHGTDFAALAGEVIIPAGSASAPVVILPYDDDVAEGNETVTLALTAFGNAYSLSQTFQATLTITDNADVPLVNVRSAAVGTEGGTNTTFIVRAIGNSAGTVTVNYSVSGTATAGVDYTPLSGSVSVSTDGANEATIIVPIINDTDLEPTKTVVVTLTPSANYKVYNDGVAEAVIQDNDNADRVMVSTHNHTPTEAGAVGGTFYFSRIGTTGALDVNYAISGTATNGVDYATLSGVVTIPDTTLGVNLVMTPIDDAVFEGAETVSVTVLPGTGYGVDRPASATFVIADNETSALTVGFTQATTTTSELPGVLGGYRDYTVQLSAASPNTVTVSYKSGGGTATGDDVDWAFVDAANSNALIPRGTLTFAPGTTTQTIRIHLRNDGLSEPAESTVLQLLNPLGAGFTAGRSALSVLIYDNTLPTLVTEERWNSTVVYTNNTWNTVNADVTNLLTSFTPSQDVADSYSRRLTGLITAPGTGSYTFWIASDDASRLYLSTDSTAANKTQIASLSGYTSFQNWTTNASQQSVAINLVAGQSYYMEAQHQEGGGGDHVSVAWQGPGFTRTPISFAAPDTAPRSVRLLLTNSQRSEADGSEPNLMAILDRPAGSSALTVDYSATGGSATPGSDYILPPGTLTFAPGEQFKLIPLAFTNDAIGEGPETIVVSIANASGASLGLPSAHTITLLDGAAPVIDSQFIYANSSQSVGALLTTATATLASGRTMGTWSIIAGNAGNAFVINASGQITLSAPSLLPNPGGVQLIVKAADTLGAEGQGVIHIICNAGAQPVSEQRWSTSTNYNSNSWTGTAGYTGTLATMTTGVDAGSDYSRRLLTYLKPQVSGSYTFWVASDDGSRLYLSTDAYEANKVQIASVSSWTNFQAWDSSSSQRSATINLQAGLTYWFEVQHLEGGGGDHASVAWSGPGIPRAAIPGSALTASVPNIAFVPQPILPGAQPTVALTSPPAGSSFISGNSINLGASVTANGQTITSVGFYRGSTLIGSDSSAPFSVVYSNAVANANESLSARVNFGSTFVSSAVVPVTVWDSNPANDADGDGFTTALEQTLGTDPYNAGSAPPAIYSNLRAWWRMEEGSGTTTADSAGSRVATLTNAPAWTTGRMGNGLQFNGTSNYLTITGSTAPAALSISAWIKPAGVTGIQSILSQQSSFSLRTNGTGMRFTTLGIKDYDIAAVLTAGTWQHLVVTFTPNTTGGLKIYVNNVLKSTQNSTGINSNTNAWQIGRTTTGEYFGGSLDDVRLYSSVLSATDVTNLYNVDSPQSPVWSSNPTSKPAATEDSAYSGQSLAGSATDPNPGDTISFSKVSGPTWLNVAADGSLSGTPSNGDAGANTFVVRATDNTSAASDATLIISVTNVNDAPIFTANPIAGSAATEDAAYSASIAGGASDVDAGDTLTFSKVSGPAWLGIASSGAVSGTPTNANVGANAFTVRVTDAAGATADATLNVIVVNVNDAPAFTANPINGGSANEDAAFSGSIASYGGDVDAGDTLTFSKVDGPAWLSVDSSGAVSGTPINANVGANVFTIRVTDTAGATADAALNISVINTNDAPTFTANPIAGVAATGDSAYSGTLAGQAIDVDVGDSLTFSKASGPAWLTLAADGALGGTPVAGDAGPNSFSVRVTDVAGAVANAILNITVVLPPSLSMSAGVAMGAPITVNFANGPGYALDWIGLYNATDGTGSGVPSIIWLYVGGSQTAGEALANGSVTFSGGLGSAGNYVARFLLNDGYSILAATSFVVNAAPVFASNPITGSAATEDAAYTSLITANDANVGDTLTYSKVSGPGWLSVAGNGAISGTPLNANVGANSFTVRATDSYGASTDATLNISVINNNDAPAFATSSITGAAATEASAYSGTLAGQASDVDVGDTLTYSKVSGPAWLSIASNGALSGTPLNANAGANSFGVRVTDSAGATGNATLNISVTNTNDAPTFTANPIAGANATEDAAYVSSIAGSATDVDAGATLTYSKLSGPAWLSVASNGALSGTPLNASVGANSFGVRVTDNAGATADATLNIAVINSNDAPAFTAPSFSKPNATAGTAYTGQTLAGSATDVDTADTLAFSKVSGPARLTVAANGTLSGTPAAADVGTGTYSVKVTDAAAANATATLIITVVARPLPAPWINADIGTVGLAGSTVYATSAFTIKGAGVIGSTADAGHLVYQTLSGDGSIVARISTLGSTGGTAARVGIQIRNTLAANSAALTLAVDGSGSFKWMRRTTTGGATSNTNSAKGTAPNIWIKLARAGNVITASKSTNGTSWTAIGNVTVTLSTNCYIGMASSSGSTTALNSSVFDSVTCLP